jgi:dinuclear metal center YbgI/SA1388 family protein
MASLRGIVDFLDEYLGVGTVSDYCPQGLQVEGVEQVDRAATGVSACMELFRSARDWGANAVIVHHGMFWDSESRVIRGSLKERVKFLLDNGISLIGYHLPLDRHPEVGNNIQIVRKLGLVAEEAFGAYKGVTLGYMAKTPGEGESASAFFEKVRGALNPSARVYPFGPAQARVIAVCSGGGQDTLREAIAKKADVFVTGEDTEWIYHLCKEELISYVAAGHHATERFGVMALADMVTARLGVETKFFDIPNPI